MTRINRYDIYRHCLKLAKEILRRGNFEGQQIYIHVGDQKYWETELLRPYRPDREPRGAVANIGLKHDGIIFGAPQELAAYKQSVDMWDMSWDWRRFSNEPVQDEPFHPLGDLQAQVEYIASLAEIKLKKAYTTNKTRFSVWGQMFDVAVDLIEANHEQELKFRLIHHGGWGTYYFEFYDNRNECLFAMSEQGHIAGVGALMSGEEAADDITQDYNLREDLLAGIPLSNCKKKLTSLYQTLAAPTVKNY